MNPQEITQKPAAIIASVVHHVTVDWNDHTKQPTRIHTFNCRGDAFEMARKIQKCERDAHVMVWTPHSNGGLISYPKNDWASA